MKLRKIIYPALATMLAWPFMLQAADPTWIDVRAPEEFSRFRVDGAINIPHEQIVSGVATLDLEKDQVIYVYCRSGERSSKAKAELMKAGYTQVIDVGGLDDAFEKSDELRAAR